MLFWQGLVCTPVCRLQNGNGLLLTCCLCYSLIPNLSYVSEAAAYVLDARLRTNMVPYTDIVRLSSKSFFYDFWDRRKAWKGKKTLPPKAGSFQVFLKGYKDANIFLREHPWPDQANPGLRPEDAPKRKKRPWNEACRPLAGRGVLLTEVFSVRRRRRHNPDLSRVSVVLHNGHGDDARGGHGDLRTARLDNPCYCGACYGKCT